ncbi:MAG: serine/threonine-protein kinase [Leptolyngbyaceae bacterium]|nr:serine/threonine-protein kinase [Leptolyngbyaceae bacterium]
MSYCLNLDCPAPRNPDTNNYCEACGQLLLLAARYRALEPLGQGGFGKTYLAIDEGFEGEPRCVIKQQIYQMGDRPSPEAIERFRQEVDRLAELGQHPQIPALLDSVEEEDGNYLIQEFIEGHDFESVLEEDGPFEEEGIRQLLEDLLPVLSFVHDRRIIHRDIKPRNLIAPLVDSPVVLVDFGSSKKATQTALARTGTVIGSAGFLAPEQAMGKAVFSSDLYSLGVTCVHLLTGLHPFELYSVSQDAWVWQQYLLEPVSDELAYVLNKMLRRSVNQRYRTAAAALKDLRSPPPDVGIQQTRRLTYDLPKGIAAVASYAPDPDFKAPPPDPDYEPVPQAADVPEQPWYCAHQLIGHGGAITTVAVSPSGQVLASGSTDRRIMLWNMQSGTKLHTIEGKSLLQNDGHTDRITTLCFTPDGSTLVSGSDDGTIKLWDLSERKLISTLSSSEWVISAIAISPDGSLLVSGGDNGVIEFWDLERGEFIERIHKHGDRITQLYIHPDGKALLSSSHDQTIRLWDLRTAELLNTFRAHRAPIEAFAVSPDWFVMVSGSGDGEMTFWDIAKATPIKTILAHQDAVRCLAAGPAVESSSWLFASGGEDTCIQLWEIQIINELAQIPPAQAALVRPPRPSTESPRFTYPDTAQPQSVSSPSPPEMQGTRASRIERLHVLQHGWSVSSLAFSPLGTQLVSASVDESIKIWQRG